MNLKESQAGNSILGDPGAVIRVGRIGATKVFRLIALGSPRMG